MHKSQPQRINIAKLDEEMCSDQEPTPDDAAQSDNRAGEDITEYVITADSKPTQCVFQVADEQFTFKLEELVPRTIIGERLFGKYLKMKHQPASRAQIKQMYRGMKKQRKNS